MTLVTNFAPNNVTLKLDDVTGITNANLFEPVGVGTGDGIIFTFTGVLANTPICDVLNININGTPIGSLTVDKLNTPWTLSAVGLVGVDSTLDPESGAFSLKFSTPPLVGDNVSMEIVSDQSQWSFISGMRKGYRILENATGGGQAVVLENPQFQSPTVSVQIIIPFISDTLTYGNWMLRVPRERNIGTYVPDHVKSTKILPEYFESLQSISIDEVQDAIHRLRNIRRWDKMDSEYLDVFLQSMGMFLNTEQFDTETRRRLVKELPNFLELSGTENFLNYLGFVVGALFTSDQLYTKDYITFIPYADIPTLELDDYYPTNYVELEFDAGVFGNITDSNLIIDAFYQLASLPLVLYRVNQQFNLDTVNVIGNTGGYSIEHYTATLI